MKITMVGPFALSPKHTVSGRALPLARALARRGHTVRVLVPPWDRPEDSGLAYADQGVEVRHVRVPSRPGLPAHAAIAARLLRAALPAADVVHAFKPKGHAGVAAMALWLLRAAGLHGARVVVDADDLEGAGGWNERGGYGPAARRVFAWQERRGLAACDAVTAASRALAGLARSCGARDVHYLPNGLSALADLPDRDAARRALGASDGPLALVYTRFVEIGPEHLAALLDGLCRGAPDARAIVVGAGLRGEHERLAAAVRERGLAGRVSLAGWVAPRRLPIFRAAADLALFPVEDTPLNRAKSPLRLLELMGAGQAIAAHAVGEAAEFLADGAGLLAAPGDDEAFVAGVLRLCGDPALRATLGAAARERIATTYNWDRLAEVAERAYGALDQSANGSGGQRPRVVRRGNEEPMTFSRYYIRGVTRAVEAGGDAVAARPGVDGGDILLLVAGQGAAAVGLAGRARLGP